MLSSCIVHRRAVGIFGGVFVGGGGNCGCAMSTNEYSELSFERYCSLDSVNDDSDAGESDSGEEEADDVVAFGVIVSARER
jgi:hypothetical protein